MLEHVPSGTRHKELQLMLTQLASNVKSTLVHTFFQPVIVLAV